MGLRCSLFGHRYGEHEVDREREERGDEVVVVTKEYKVCSVCGERILVSENKEIRSQASGDEPEAADQTATVASASGSMASDQPTGGDGGIILEDETDEGPPEWPDPTPASKEPATETTSDAAESTPWPDHAAETDEGFAAAGPADASAPDVEYQGLNPSTDDPTGAAEATPSDDGGEILDPADTSAVAPEVDKPPRPTEQMTLVCPECGFVDDAGQGSLRRGDICPECLSGYLRASEERNR